MVASFLSSFRGHPALLAAVAAGALLLPDSGLAGRWLAPLDPIGLALAALVAAALVGLPHPSPRASRVALLLMAGAFAIKLAIALLVVPVGLRASYWAGDQASGPPERSTEFQRAGFAAPGDFSLGWLPGAGTGGVSRLDRELDLAGNAFPVHFFNDAARFNVYGETRPARDELPFVARWAGWFSVERDSPRRFGLETRGRADVRLDGQALLTLPMDEGRRRVEAVVSLAPGEHHIEAEYERKVGRVPLVRVDWERSPDGPLVPIGAPDVRPFPASGLLLATFRQDQPHGPANSPTQPGGPGGWNSPPEEKNIPLPGEGARGWGSLAQGLLLAGMVAWLASAAVRLRRASTAQWCRAGLVALPLLFLAYGMALNGEIADRTTILSGGNDWLTHESLARDIFLNGPLMANGRDEAAPYYAQPLYPYALALTHLFAGEGLFGPLVLQAAAVGAVLALTVILGARLSGWLGGLAALAYFWAFLQQEHLRVARQLLNENLYMPLVMASLLALLWAAGRGPRGWRLVLVGAMLGATALARSQFLLYVPLALALLGLLWRRRGHGWLRLAGGLAAVLLGLGLAIAPATARNLAVSGKPVLIASSAGINLLQSHEPHAGIDLGSINRDPLYEALGLDRETRMVVEYARQDPLGYLGTWVPHAAYSLGIPGLRRPGQEVYGGFLVTVVLYLLSIVLLPSMRRLEAWLVHAFVATHFLVMMAFASDTYGYRLVIPMYAPMVAVAAQLPVAVFQGLLRRARGSRGSAQARAWMPGGVVAILALGAALQQARGLMEVWPRRDLVYHGLLGQVGEAAELARRAGADLVYYASADGTPRPALVENPVGLQYPRTKWFDPSVVVPVPPDGARAVYALGELASRPTDRSPLTECLGSDVSGDLLLLDASTAGSRCLSGAGIDGTELARFGMVAQLYAARLPSETAAGTALEVPLHLRLLRSPDAALQAYVHVMGVGASDFDVVWGNGTAAMYPWYEWEPGEQLAVRLPVRMDPTTPPGTYPAVLGFSGVKDGRPLTVTWAGGGGDAYPLGTVHVSAAPFPSDGLLPVGFAPPTADLRGGGLSLLALRHPTDDRVRPGQAVRFGVVWRVEEQPVRAVALRLRVETPQGQMIEELTRPLLGATGAVEAVPPAGAVRDEMNVVFGPRVPDGPVRLRGELVDGSGEALGAPFDLGTVVVEGRARSFSLATQPAAIQEANFASKVELLGYTLDPSRVRPGGRFELRVFWRALSEMDEPYKVFVHVLDEGNGRVMAQQDAEPRAGEVPTTGWLTGEVIEDSYELVIPVATPAGDYPIEIGLYQARTGARLALPDGETRVLLSVTVKVGP